MKGNDKTDEGRARKKENEAPGPWHHRRDHQQWPEEGRGLPVVSGSEQGRWGARAGGGGGSGVRRRELSQFVLITYSGAGDETLNLVYAKQVPYR